MLLFRAGSFEKSLLGAGKMAQWVIFLLPTRVLLLSLTFEFEPQDWYGGRSKVQELEALTAGQPE